MTFAAYPTNLPPGFDLCANDNQNPPVLVLLSRGFNTGTARTSNPAPTVPLQAQSDVSGPVQFAGINEAPNAQPVSTNLGLGTAAQVTELSACANTLQRHNTPQLTSTVL